jgi:uncharacterized coiled-coil protein SlyX
MGDVEALAEKVGAIEKRQDRQTEASDILSQRLAAHKTRMDKQQKAIDCLEAYQRGEMPENIPENPMSVSYCYKADDFERGVFEVDCPCGRKSKIEMPEVCEGKPTGGFIRMKISRDGQPYQDRIFICESPRECLEWAKKVLDSMRGA